MASLALVPAVGLDGCKSDTAIDEAAVGVAVPCPGTSDPVPYDLPCGLVCRAALPIRASNSRLFLVDIQVNDKPALMVLDTGADRTVLSPLAAARIGLPPATLEAGRLIGGGGDVPIESTAIRSISFGHVRVEPSRAYLLPQKQTAAGTGDLGFDGMLGNDILSHYQLDLDFQHQTVRFYEGKLCPGPLPNGPAEASIVPIITEPGSNLVGVLADLDGVPVKTLLDTGAEAIIANSATAQKLHVDKDELAHDGQMPTFGVGPNIEVAQLHRFKTLALGAVTVSNPPVAITPEQSGFPGMIVGDPVLSTRRVWIDYAGRQVHFSRPD